MLQPPRLREGRHSDPPLRPVRTLISHWTSLSELPLACSVVAHCSVSWISCSSPSRPSRLSQAGVPVLLHSFIMQYANQAGCYAACAILLVASTISVGLRFMIRNVKKAKLGVDDLFISASLVCEISSQSQILRCWYPIEE